MEVQPLFLYATSIEISISKKKILPMYSLVLQEFQNINEEGCYVDLFLQVTPLFEFLNIYSTFCSLKTEWKKDTAMSFLKEESLQKVFPPNEQCNMFQIIFFLSLTNKIIFICLLIDATCISFRYMYCKFLILCEYVYLITRFRCFA